MDNHIDGKISGYREVDEFIVRNDRDGFLLTTRCAHWDNYFKHLQDLIDHDQLLVQRNKYGEISAVCGYILYDKSMKDHINKVNWTFPPIIDMGDCLYISFCVVDDGSIHQFKAMLRERLSGQIQEVSWFNSPTNKFLHKRNILKESFHASDTELRS